MAMIYEPRVPEVGIFENYIGTQQMQGHSTEGGPLPSFLLTQQFEETPGVFDGHSYHDFARATLADHRPDPPLFEDEQPRDVRAWSQTRLNVRSAGTRSGADPAAHPEIFLGFLDADTRVPGDGNVPMRKLAEQGAARAHYWRPSEPRNASNRTEAITEGIEPENLRYEKLRVARERTRANLRMFGRTIMNDRGAQSTRVWGASTDPCDVAEQDADGGAGSCVARDADAEEPARVHREQVRAEYVPGDEKRTRSAQGTGRVPCRGGDAEATLRATRAVAQDGGVSDALRAENEAVACAPSRTVDVSARAIARARARIHGAESANDIILARGYADAETRAAPRADLCGLAARMRSAAVLDCVNDASARPTATLRRAWHMDGSDPLAFARREVMEDATRGREILHIATEIARKSVRGPRACAQARAPIDDAVPSYLAVDALLMRAGATGTPADADLIRRHMIRDARAPTGSEIAFANRAAYKGIVTCGTTRESCGVRDIEMGDDAIVRASARARPLQDALPRAWTSAAGALTDPRDSFVADPRADATAISARAAPRAEARGTGYAVAREGVRALAQGCDTPVSSHSGARLRRARGSSALHFARALAPAEGRRALDDARDDDELQRDDIRA